MCSFGILSELVDRFCCYLIELGNTKFVGKAKYFTEFFDGVPNEVDSKIRYYCSFFWHSNQFL